MYYLGISICVLIYILLGWFIFHSQRVHLCGYIYSFISFTLSVIHPNFMYYIIHICEYLLPIG